MSNILVLGNGAREHVIINKLLESSKVLKVYTLNNNNSINNTENICNDIKNIVEICQDKKIDLVVVGPEQYLVDGIYDLLLQNNIKCFGPSKNASMIEGCKIFAKNLMNIFNIPTAKYKIYNNMNDVRDIFLGKFNNNYVIKYPGLAGGKGVVIPNTISEGIQASIEMLSKDVEIIIEEKLYGEEVSVLGFCNGTDVMLMPQTQDYKTIYDNNTGPNTGGMGAICPANVLNENELEQVKIYMEKIVRELNYVGVLYAGLMKTKNGIYFLEFNCRFGDPETQVILNLLETDLYEIIMACINRQTIAIVWKKEYAANIVLAHQDYPESKLDEPIKINIGNMHKSIKLYYGNINNGYTTGGRVLSIVCTADTLYKALAIIYNNINKVSFDGSYYRKDIGINQLIKKSPLIAPHIAILGSTNGTSCLGLLKGIMNKEISANVKVIVTDKKNAGILEKAKEYNIPFIYLPKKDLSKEQYDEILVNLLRCYQIDLVFLVGYMKIVSKVLIDEYKDRILNIHPSLLPKYNGMMDLNVHQAVLDNNEKVSGCTLHVVTEEVDGGRIVLQSQCLINEDNVDTLKEKVQKLETECIINYIKIFSSFKIGYSVDIEQGNHFVEMLKKDNNKIGGFCSLVKYQDTILGVAADGVGTKLDIANDYNMLDTIGIDLVAMNVNDLIACGITPLFFLDYIAIDKMDVNKCNKLLNGIKEGCRIAKCELIGGETAEMNGIYFNNKFDVAGFAIGGVSQSETTLLPKINMMDENCVIYGLRSNGIHSNGYTLVRKLLKYHTFNISTILKPTIIYMQVLEMLADYPEVVLGAAHITGGGFIDNIPRVLPDHLTFKITETWDRPSVFNWIQNKSQLSDNEMEKTFNCGIGMVLVLKNPTREFIENYNLIKLGNLVVKHSFISQDH